LTTLFPPVRPRGHLELRAIDAQRTDADWSAALTFVWALLSDPRAADAAREALAPLAADPQVPARAVRDGLTDPLLARVARRCFEVAGEACDRLNVSGLRTDLDRFNEGYVARGRCPADDTLAEFGAAPSMEVPCPAIA
jgi:glutamate--cysteine ligase